MTDEPTIAERLARWALELRLDQVPDDVLERMKLHVLDQIGAQLSCHDRPVAVDSRAYARRYARTGAATIVGSALRLDAEAAAFVNATTGHSFEIDDYAQGAFAHPGCVVVPGALAVGEERGASGAAVLTAIVAGFEHVVRLGLASMPSMLLHRGFHETCAHGVFAVALTTSMLAGSDVPTTVHALAVGGSHASGTTEYAQSGGEVKRVHAGLGAMGGVRAARLAEAGISGPGTIFEGKRGFLQAFCDEHDASFIWEGLGERWRFPDHAAIKPHACVGSIHANYAALDKITASTPLAPDDIESVMLGVDKLAKGHAGSIGPRPWDMVSAQFSAHYGIGLRIVKEANDVDTYLAAEEGGFADPDVLRVAERVTLVVDDDASAEWPRAWLGRTTVHTTDGRTLTDTAYGLGTPSNPMDRAAIEAKFSTLASRAIGPQAADSVRDLVLQMEDIEDIRELTGLLAPTDESEDH